MSGKIAFPSAERQKYNTPNNDNSNNKKWLELYHVNIFHSRLAANHHTENCHKSLDESEKKNDNEQEHNSKYYMYFCNKFE